VGVKTLIHVGFCHSGTTSLQENFFARRPDIFYRSSFGDCGGIFSYIKYEDEGARTERTLERLSEQHIFAKIGPHQRLVLSDETFVEQPEIYYTPQKMPISLIAQRMKRLFPKAKILFTTRNQFDYVASCYLNLKRNYAYLANRSMEDFDAWFAGNLTQIANLYLRNLDYSRAVTTFQRFFGSAAVTVLPLESLELQGAAAYLRKISELLSIEITAEDLENFQPIRNRRMSGLEDALLTHWHDPAYRNLYDAFVVAIGPARLRDLLDAAGPAQIVLNEQQIAQIHQRCADGNLYLEREFGLDLSVLGYPMPDTQVHLIHSSWSRSLARNVLSPAIPFRHSAVS
jgi:hypothetical protein